MSAPLRPPDRDPASGMGARAAGGPARGTPAREPAVAGSLYGIGLGPGDPELITVKGLRLLQQAAVVFVPTRRHGAPSYAASIAAPYLAPERQEIVPLVYPSASAATAATDRWDANADEIAARLRDGRLGVFLTEGDPLLYSTFVHALLPLRARHPEIQVGVVPGVWSGSAAAAALARPLVDGDERLAVLPACYAGPELAALVRQFDTLVLLKPPEDVRSLSAALAALGATATWVERVGTPAERVVDDLAAWPACREAYFSLAIVRGGRHLCAVAATDQAEGGLS